jgi:maltose-binding protein MalE
LDILYGILKDFQAKFPGIRISLAYVPEGELKDAYLAASQEGRPPTLIIGPTEWRDELAQGGYLRAIHDRVGEDLLELVRPLAWENVRSGGETWALPVSLEGIVLFRNKSLIGNSPSTVDEWVSLSETVEGEGTQGLILDLGFHYLGGFLQACDGELIGEDGFFALTLSATDCWLGAVAELRQAGDVTRNDDLDLESFEAGRSAWLIDGTWNSERIVRIIGEDQLGVDPWPILDETGKPLAGYASSYNLYFSASADAEDFNAAWLVARFLLTQEAQAAFMEGTFGRRVSVLASVPLDEAWLDELQTAIGGNIRLPYYDEFDDFAELLEGSADEVGRLEFDHAFSAQWVHTKLMLRLSSLVE